MTAETAPAPARDAAYLHVLKACGVPASKALAVVDDLANHRKDTTA